MTQTLVIGAGLGGIATALRLRAKGDDVEVLERLSAPGGRAQVFERNGFKHDAGPTVITAPFLFDELFALFGEKREDYLDFKPLDLWYRFYFDETGDTFDYAASIEKTKAEIARFRPEDADGYDRLLKTSKAIFDVGFTKLADKPFTKFSAMLAQIPSLLTLKSYLSVAQLVNMHVKHPQIRQAFSIHPLLVGGNPFDTTSIYALIHYLEREWGVFFCMGGTGTLIKELEALMIRQGISIRCNTDIEQILVEKGRTSGVRTTSGEIISSDRVICNADTPAVYDELLSAQPKRRKKAIPDKLTRYSMGLYVLFFGTRKKYDSIAHHTIWMGKRYRALLADIFNSKILADDFSLYLHRPTATDPTFAPDGCDSFYVLCPVPNLQGNVNWDVQGPALQERIITALNRTIMPELKETITDAFWMSPREFKSNYRAKHGAGFSIAPIFAQSAWFRYHNQDPHIDNLFFTGAGTHPGAGMPGVLSSAKVVENLITNMPEEQAP
ncbi:phytoene desaturase family protein [Alphaproteobacteria bacterium]|nr:phytoene desaturase family protein [Alphaproteobacteria bacterium]